MTNKTYMRIGIDARTILNPERGDAIGVGHYTYQLIRHLLEIDQKNEYVLFFDFRVREKDVKKFTKLNVKIKFYPFSDYKKYLPGAYNEILGTATLAREHLDIIHSTSPSSRIPATYRGKTIVTVHDLASYKVPDIFPAFKVAKYKATMNLMVSKADKIIAVSNSTKNDLCEIFGCPAEKVNVIYSGFDSRLFEESKIAREKVLAKYEINNGKKYILFLGTLEPVKNLARLFEAFKIFKEKCEKEKGNCDYKLVIAGKKGWMGKEYRQIAKDLGIAKDVIFTGYIIGDELVPLFKNAEFFIMPSLYEGFGSTVLEAFATGTPAIVSNVSSIPELAGDAAIMINPLDTKEIADSMYEISCDDKLRYDLRQKGYKQVEKFDWKKCAAETLAIYESLK
ncbi:MAG TPA: glycosyltransferase family 1 protein [Patescibacteria group bacterium]|nr:glycosyltransferase family 1 protein [Patescibacteria group bacterium]